MSVVETLLIGEKNLQKLKSNSKQPAFLLDLIKNMKKEPDKLLSVLQNLNISKEDIQKLIDSLNKGDKKENKDLLKLMNQIKNNLNNFKTTKSNTDNIFEIKESENSVQNTNINKKNDTVSVLKQLITKEIPNKEFEKKIKKIIEKNVAKQNETILIHHTETKTLKPDSISVTEKKTVSVIKKIIESKHIFKNLELTTKEKNEFKNITTLKGLIDFADKKNLNLSKIVLSQKNETSNEMPQIPMQKLSVSKNIFEIKTEFAKKHSIKVNNEKNSPLNFLLGNKTDKQKPVKIKEKNDTHQNMLFSNVNTDLKQTIINAKESIRHFAQNLKEAVENYKPPMSKISLELNPKELGKIEMTLIHRGDNLQIQINGQNQTVNFFNIHQNELRQTLVNMGYSDVNMSFNQQQNQQNQREKYRQNQQNFSKEEDEFIIEIPYKYA